MANTGERLLNAVRDQMAECGRPDVQEVARVVVGGASYLVRSLSAERLAALYVWRKSNRTDTRGLYARFVVAALADARGEPLLTAADIPNVEAWPPMVLESLMVAIRRHNHMG